MIANVLYLLLRVFASGVARGASEGAHELIQPFKNAKFRPNYA